MANTLLPPARRVVTGHDNNGKAIIESDTTFEPFDPRSVLPGIQNKILDYNGTKPKGGFIHLWCTETAPAKLQGPWTEYHNKAIPLSDKAGTTVRIVDMAPGQSSPLHRTVSMDFGVVLIGEVELELDDGLKTVLKAGDTCVQRGTIHAWHNRTTHPARVLFVLIPAENIVIDGKPLEPTRFAIN